MSLISEEGVFKPVYYLHQHYYYKMSQYLKHYRKEFHRYPTKEEFVW